MVHNRALPLLKCQGALLGLRKRPSLSFRDSALTFDLRQALFFLRGAGLHGGAGRTIALRRRRNWRMFSVHPDPLDQDSFDRPVLSISRGSGRELAVAASMEALEPLE